MIGSVVELVAEERVWGLGSSEAWNRIDITIPTQEHPAFVPAFPNSGVGSSYLIG